MLPGPPKLLFQTLSLHVCCASLLASSAKTTTTCSTMTGVGGGHDSSAVLTAHSTVTLELAKKESAEHMEGMQEVYEKMRRRPLTVKAYHHDDPHAPDHDAVKTVHFVRHGQGFHNLMADMARANGVEWKQFSQQPENPYTMPEILDAPLTEKGRQQALQLRSAIAVLPEKPQLLVSSSNCRALQTAVLAFEDILSPTVPFLAHEMVREETGAHTCDKRRPVSRQRAEFPQVDFSLIPTEEDQLYRDTVRETKLEVGERIYKFMEWLAEREEKHVGVASHSGWLLTLFNGIVHADCDAALKEWWHTGEMRSVKLEFITQQQ